MKSRLACSFEVTVTSVSLPPLMSRRGLSNTNQRLSRPKPLQGTTPPPMIRRTLCLSMSCCVGRLREQKGMKSRPKPLQGTTPSPMIRRTLRSLLSSTATRPTRLTSSRIRKHDQATALYQVYRDSILDTDVLRLPLLAPAFCMYSPPCRLCVSVDARLLRHLAPAGGA